MFIKTFTLIKERWNVASEYSEFLKTAILQKNSALFNTRKFKPDLSFIKHLIKFGFPNGIHLFFEIPIFTFFTLVVDTLGTLELTTANTTITIYSLFYIPIAGCGITTSIIVRNYLSKNKASIAQMDIKTALPIICTYIHANVLYTKHTCYNISSQWDYMLEHFNYLWIWNYAHNFFFLKIQKPNKWKRMLIKDRASLSLKKKEELLN
jgi:hypothetical protein